MTLPLSGFCPAERIQGAGLPVERAILHGKLGEHEQALRVLVHELGDTAAAEDYCLWSSEGQDTPCRQHLFHTLLAMYLQAGPAAPTLTVAAVDLLNRHATDFDAAQVLQLLPGSWSVQLLSPFLTGAMRGTVHARRTAQVALGLARSENLLYAADKVGTAQGCGVPLFSRGQQRRGWRSQMGQGSHQSSCTPCMSDACTLCSLEVLSASSSPHVVSSYTQGRQRFRGSQGPCTEVPLLRHCPYSLLPLG